MTEAQAQLEAFLAKYTPDVAETGRAAIARMQALLPACDALVYDNYNALAVAFSFDGKTGSAFCSVALYPRWVSLFVSAKLDDPHGLLEGGGSSLRHHKLRGGASDLDRPEVRALIDQSIARAEPYLVAGRQGHLVIKSISAKQRPRQ